MVGGQVIKKWFKKTTPSVEPAPEPVPYIERKSIPLIDIYRNFAYDAGFKDPEGLVARYAPTLYTPVSEDGIEKIEEDSNARCDTLSPIVHVLHAQAMFGAAAFADIWCTHKGLSEDEREEVLDIIVPFAHVVLMGSLAGLQEYLGDLHVAAAGVVPGD